MFVPDFVIALTEPPLNPLILTSKGATATSICAIASSDTGFALESPPFVPDEDSPYISLLAIPSTINALKRFAEFLGKP